jgi:hypothetical protein
MKTMPQLVEKARERLQELEAEAERLRTFIGVYADLAGEEVVEKSGSEPDTEDDESHASPAQIIESARAAMRERGRPLSRSRLVKILETKGLKLGGVDKAKNIGTVIWRSKQFDNIAGEGYWPKDFERWIGQRVKDAAEPELLIG